MNSPDLTPLELAIIAVDSAAELARRLSAHTGENIQSQHITNWKTRGIPVERCTAIEAVTGVRCEVLRPDVQWKRDKSGEVAGYFVPIDKAA